MLGRLRGQEEKSRKDEIVGYAPARNGHQSLSKLQEMKVRTGKPGMLYSPCGCKSSTQLNNNTNNRTLVFSYMFLGK